MNKKALLIMRDETGRSDGRWTLEERTTSIGRDESADVQLSDREVSRKHAQIIWKDGRFALVDLGSKNGTRVNGERVDGVVMLRDGDEIRIAPHFRLLFVDSDATAPATSLPPGIRLESAQRAVWVAGQLVDPPLAPNQYGLLELLARKPGRVYSRPEIAAACYPDTPQDAVSDQAIDGIVRRLRSRLAEFDPETEHIAAVRGHGFRLVVPILR